MLSRIHAGLLVLATPFLPLDSAAPCGAGAPPAAAAPIALVAGGCAGNYSHLSACGQLEVTLSQVEVNASQFNGSVQLITAKIPKPNTGTHTVDKLAFKVFIDRNNNNAPDDGEIVKEGSVTGTSNGASTQVGNFSWSSVDPAPKVQFCAEASNGATANYTGGIAGLSKKGS